MIAHIKLVETRQLNINRHKLTLINFRQWVAKTIHVCAWKTQVVYLSLVRHTSCNVTGMIVCTDGLFSSAVVTRHYRQNLTSTQTQCTCNANGECQCIHKTNAMQARHKWNENGNPTKTQHKCNGRVVCVQRKLNGNFPVDCYCLYNTFLKNVIWATPRLWVGDTQRCLLSLKFTKWFIIHYNLAMRIPTSYMYTCACIQGWMSRLNAWLMPPLDLTCMVEPAGRFTTCCRLVTSNYPRG